MKNGIFIIFAVLLLSAVTLGGCGTQSQGRTDTAGDERSTAIGTENGNRDPTMEETSDEGMKISDESIFEYEIQELSAWRGENQIYGVVYIPRSYRQGEGVSQIVAAFQAYDADVEVLFELEANETSGPETAQGSRQLTITLDDTDVIYAALLDTPAADAFAEHLPLTLDMTDYVNREKHAHLEFTIDDSDLENIQYPYEIGDIIYYPPGPTFAMYYDHDGREISAGMEVIARLDENGIETLGTYPVDVKVTVELSN